MESSHPQGGSGGGGGGGGVGGASSPAPFLVKTYEMVEDPSTNRVVSWGPCGASFVVWNPPDFSRDLLPKYFKHNNFSSFIRQLNTYGFRKIDPERWEFANEEFVRGHMHLLKNIHRRKPVHSHSPQTPLAEAERRELEDEIDRLKQEKSALQADLQRQAQRQSGISWQMQSLEERLVHMQRRQENIVASLCDILQRRGSVVVSGSSSSPLETDDHFSKKRRVPKHDFFVEEPVVEELKVPAVSETAGLFPVHAVDAEPFDRMELALVSLEKFIQRANSYASSEDMYGGAAAAPSPALTPEDMQAMPMAMDTTINLQPYSPPEPAESPGYAQSPILLFEGIHGDVRNAATEADMNSEGSTTDTSQEEMPTETEISDEPAAANDVFWERFLTETPQSGPKDDLRIGVDCNWLKHRDSVVQITEQMGHLAPAEKTLMA